MHQIERRLSAQAQPVEDGGSSNEGGKISAFSTREGHKLRRGTDDGTETPDEVRSLLLEAAEDRHKRLAEALTGGTNEIDVDDLMLAIEVDAPLMQSDHTRLLRAASLAIQYYRVNPAGHSERAFLKKAAAALQVNPRELEAYALVLGREIRHREKTGCSPLNDLPRLTGTRELAEAHAAEHLALPPSARSKHDPSEYVALAEQSFNNTEISKILGDVSEASVRRGLAAAGYKRW